MAYSSSVRLTWEIFSITVSGEGPATQGNVVSNLAGDMTKSLSQSLPPFATLNLIPKSPAGPPGL